MSVKDSKSRTLVSLTESWSRSFPGTTPTELQGRHGFGLAKLTVLGAWVGTQCAERQSTQEMMRRNVMKLGSGDKEGLGLVKVKRKKSSENKQVQAGCSKAY